LFIIGALAAGKKPSDQAKSTPEKPVEPIEKPMPEVPKTPEVTLNTVDMEIIDYIRSGALILAFVAALFAGRTNWLKANTLIYGAMGSAMYFFPKALLDYQTEGKLDLLHLYLAQQMGSCMIAASLLTHYSSLSKSAAVSNSLMLTRVIGAIFMLVVGFMDASKMEGSEQKLSSHHTTFTLLALGLGLVGNLVYVFRSGELGGAAVSLRNRVSVGIFIDTFFVMLFGIASFGYPEMGLASLNGIKPDGIHGHYVRSLGAVQIMVGLHGLSSLSFDNDKDKRLYIVGRIIALIFSLPVYGLYQWKYAFVTTDYFYSTMGISAAISLNLLLTYYHPVSLPKMPSLKFWKRD